MVDKRNVDPMIISTSFRLLTNCLLFSECLTIHPYLCLLYAKYDPGAVGSWRLTASLPTASQPLVLFLGG